MTTTPVGKDGAEVSAIEQNTIKRRGVGLRGHDQDRAFPCFTLFAPDGKPDGKTVYLIDMQGRVSHTWEMPRPVGLTPSFTDRGTLLVRQPVFRRNSQGAAQPRGSRLSVFIQ